MTNYFETLEAALDEAARRAYADEAEFDAEELLAGFSGGVKYGETRRVSLPLSKYKGRIFNRFGKPRALTVVIYRVESGRYELTSYIL